MSKKKSELPSIEPPVRASVEASAKAEASLKITRKTVTSISVPEDVTRASANAWLDLVSPLTQWAGLQGDKLKHRRELLRVYQEQRLTSIVESAREKIGELEGAGEPIPLKFIAPFVEKASVEDDDPALADLWASLLASAYKDYKPEYVHFCTIISQMSTSQARILRDVIGTDSAHSLELGHDSISIYYTQVSASRSIQRFLTDKNPNVVTVDELSDWLENWFNLVGTSLVVLMVDHKDDMIDITPEYQTYVDDDEVDYSIVEALGLITRVETDFFDWKDFAITATYYALTPLGFHFALSCGLVS